MSAERLEPGNGFPEEGVFYDKCEFSTMLLSMLSLEYYPQGWDRETVFNALEYLEGHKLGQDGRVCLTFDEEGSMLIAFEELPTSFLKQNLPS